MRACSLAERSVGRPRERVASRRPRAACGGHVRGCWLRKVPGGGGRGASVFLYNFLDIEREVIELNGIFTSTDVRSTLDGEPKELPRAMMDALGATRVSVQVRQVCDPRPTCETTSFDL